MASGAVSAAIEDFLIASWTATPLLFENKNNAEDGTVLPPADPAPFVELSFTGRTYGQQSIGASLQKDNRWDETGMMFFDVLVPRGTGSRDARTYAKSLCDLFRGLTTLLNGNLEFQDASIGEGSNSDRYAGNYFIIPVRLRRIIYRNRPSKTPSSICQNTTTSKSFTPLPLACAWPALT
jgi:hypothetical protein